jgi:hypothetical protein
MVKLNSTNSYVLSRRLKVVAPLILGILLFVLNHLAIISGWLEPPEGYSATFMDRSQDIAQYLAWANGYLHQNLVPSYHAPWATQPAFFNLFIWTVAKVSVLTSLELSSVYNGFHFIFYVIAAYALFFAVRTFTETSKEFLSVFLVIICVVPFPSLAVLPQYLIGKSGPPIGVGYFVWLSSDGIFHGISGSALVTFGTMMTLLAFSLLAKYMNTERRRYLIFAVLATFLTALVHVTEALLIAGAGGLALLWWRGKQWKRAIPGIVGLGLALVCGLLPYAIMFFNQSWLQDLAKLSHGGVSAPPYEIIVMLGLPATLVIAFLATRPRLVAPTDRLLLCWFCFVLIGIYLPVIHWSQHLFDGFHYATAILLVRLASQSSIFAKLYNGHPRLVQSTAGLICLLSVSAYIAYYGQSFHDGRLASPERLFSTVAPQKELAVIDWMRHNTRSDELVLAPSDNAPWISTVPIHSFGSHWLWSMSFPDQSRQANRFYQGEMTSEEARCLIANYGIRYVVINSNSLGTNYLDDAEKRADFDGLSVYEFKDNTMKPYPGLKTLVGSAH